jgi:hypothetical protein
MFKAEEMIYLASVMFRKFAILSLYIGLFVNPVLLSLTSPRFSSLAS